MIKIFSPIKQSIKTDESENFISSFALSKYAEYMTINLTDRAFIYVFDVQFDYTNDFDFDSFFYIFTERYNFKEFYDIMIDIGASKYSIADYDQYLTFKKKEKNCIDESKAEAIHVQFEIGYITLISAVIRQTFLRKIEFHVVKADTLFLFCFSNINRLNVYLNNISNVLILKNKSISIVRRFKHLFLFGNETLHAYIIQFFLSNFCFFIETELCRLHKRFEHFSMNKLRMLLKRSDYKNIEKAALKRFIKYCGFCQKHGKLLGRFKFSLKKNVDFNYSIVVDLMFIDNYFILHVIDESTKFQTIKGFFNISVKHIGKILRLCGIDVY